MIHFIMASKMYELAVPTLQQISLVKATTTLLKCHSHYYKLILDLNRSTGHECYPIIKEMEEFWDEKINTLSIPESFKPLLLSFFKIEYLEIEKLLKYLDKIDIIHIENNSNTSLWLNLTNYIQWSVHGQIDSAKTAQQLVTLDKELSIHERFKLATCFCLENEIKNIWKEHSNDLKIEYIHNYDFIESNDICYFWTLMLSSPEKIGQKHRLFEMAIGSHNLSAVKYFWSLMTNEEKNSINFNIEKIEFGLVGYESAISCFLLSQMSKQKVIDYLTSLHIDNSYFFLYQLIYNWLYMDFFTLTIEHVGYSLINVDDYYRLLRYSLDSDMIMSYKIDTYKKIFEDLWTNASSEVKKEIIQQEITNFSSIGISLCQLKDLKLIEVFLKDVNMVKRRQLLLRCLYMNICLIDLDFYKDVAEKFILIEEEMVLLKNECANKAYEICKDYYFFPYANRLVNKNLMLDSFLKFCFPLTENVTDFKKGLINQCIVFDLMKNYPRENQLELIDECLKWCELTENEIEEVKINLVYGSTIVIWCITLFQLDKRIIGSSDRLLNWCLHTPERIIEFKTKRLVHSCYFIEKLFECVRDNKCNNVDECLNWCFSSKDEIDEYKRNLLYKFKLSSHFRRIDKYDEYLNEVKKCLQFCMFPTETLENWWSAHFPFSPIEFHDYELFDAIMSLYYPNFLEMKKDLLLSDFGVSICTDYIVCTYESILNNERYKVSIFSHELIDKFQSCRGPVAYLVIHYLYWLSPNAEIISQFKDVFEKGNRSNLVQNFDSFLFDLLDTSSDL